MACEKATEPSVYHRQGMSLWLAPLSATLRKRRLAKGRKSIRFASAAVRGQLTAFYTSFKFSLWSDTISMGKCGLYCAHCSSHRGQKLIQIIGVTLMDIGKPSTWRQTCTINTSTDYFGIQPGALLWHDLPFITTWIQDPTWFFGKERCCL
jgi:hypothetical protein